MVTSHVDARTLNPASEHLSPCKPGNTTSWQDPGSRQVLFL